jgi:hypothetical protein
MGKKKREISLPKGTAWGNGGEKKERFLFLKVQPGAMGEKKKRLLFLKVQPGAMGKKKREISLPKGTAWGNGGEKKRDFSS